MQGQNRRSGKCFDINLIRKERDKELEILYKVKAIAKDLSSCEVR